MNETTALQRLKYELGDDLINAMDPQWLIGILNNKTLLTFSIFYPFIVKGILVRIENAILSRHPQTGDIALYKYIIKNESEDLPFIGIENFYFPGNFTGDRMNAMAPPMVASMMSSVTSILNTPQIRFAVTFEPPNIAIVDPIPRLHRDFTLNMQRVRRLNEFPLYYYDLIMDLFICDVKHAIYMRYKNLRDGATIAGIDIQTYISDFSSAADDRKSLIELYRKDYYKNPERFESFLQFQ